MKELEIKIKVKFDECKTVCSLAGIKIPDEIQSFEGVNEEHIQEYLNELLQDVPGYRLLFSNIATGALAKAKNL